MQIVELYFIGLFYIVSKIKSPCKLGICLFTKNFRICTISVHSALEIMQLEEEIRRQEEDYTDSLID